MEVRPELAYSPCSRLPKQKSGAHLPNLSREARLWSTVVDELPGGHSKGGGFSSAALEGSVALPSGANPRTGQRAPTQGPAITKAKRVSARVFRLLPVLACLCRGFPGSGSLVLRPCPFGFLFVLFRLMFLSAGRGRHVPAPGGRDVGSSSGAPTQEPVQGADPRTGFFRYPSTYDFVVYLLAPLFPKVNSDHRYLDVDSELRCEAGCFRGGSWVSNARSFF